MSCIDTNAIRFAANYFQTNHIYFPPNFLKFQMLVYHQSACNLYFLLKIKYAKFKNGWRHYLYAYQIVVAVWFISLNCMCRFTRNDICSWKGRWLMLCTLIHTAHNVWPDDGAMEMFCLTNQGVDDSHHFAGARLRS
jgi:hypothetical protein